MDLDFTEEQQMLRETVRRLCEEHTPVSYTHLRAHET